MSADSYILKRLELLDKEIAQLRRMVKGERLYKSAELRGIIKGIRFTQEEMAEARRSLFRVES